MSETTDAVDPRRQTRRVLLWSAGITLVLWLIPFGRFVAYPLLLLSTLVHELGHGLSALLVGGDFVRLEVFADGAGVAFSAVSGDWQRALVAAGGLVGPAVAALVGFTAGRTDRGARAVLLGTAALMAWTMLFWVRGVVGLLTAAGLLAVCAGAIVVGRQRPWVPQLLVVFLSVQLALSVFSRSDYLFTRLSTVSGGRALSDSEAIATALFGPWWLWGAVCGLASIAALVVGARLLLASVLPPDADTA